MIEKGISKRKQRGIIVLLIVLTVITIAPRIYLWIFPKDEVIVYIDEFDEEMGSIEKRIGQAKKSSYQKKEKYSRPKSKFDPNQYTSEDWMAVGLSVKQAAIVLKFTDKGIYSNEDLKKIFVIDEKLFELLKDSTYYPAKPEKNYSNPSEKKEKEVLMVNINTASVENLQSLPGIGEFYAKKIVEQREKLGGYHSKVQLLELWKFDQEKLDKIKNHISIDVKDIQQININTATADVLAKHPYITWNIANSIVKMRKKLDRYTDVQQLLESELITTELLQKLKPYLNVE